MQKTNNPRRDGAAAEGGIVIKGNRHGLAIALEFGLWDDALAALDGRIAETPEFFKGARVSLDVGAHRLLESDARTVRDMLCRHDMILWHLIGADEETRRMSVAMGLNAELPRTEPRDRPAGPPEEEASEPASTDTPDADLLTRRTLRSGQQLRHPGSVSLIGDMNPGSEIIAGRDIIVWGKLRGTVHAGALGDEGAHICALDMQPTQLRIARHIVRAPEDRRRKPVPEVARVRDGQIVVELWNVK